MKKTAFFFLFFITLVAASSDAQVMKPIKFEEYDLPNGLHVILYPEHSAPVVSTRVYYHVGSKNERADRTGFAHFFEHLMFESTDDIKRGEYGKNIEAAGGELNAHTSLDRTFYQEDVPANYLRMALWGESERMHFLHVDAAGVETQRQVVKEEKRNRYDNQPYGTFFPKMMESVFKTSQYRWTPIGQAQYIDEATIQEFQDFYHTYYVPNNACLVIAGDFETADAKKAVEDYFGSIPKGAEIARSYTPEPPQTSERYTEVDEKITPLPAVAYAWRTVPEGDKDAYALDLLTNVLAQGNSSRLVKRLKDKDQLVVEIEPIVLTLEKDGVFGMLAVAKAGVEIPKVRSAMDEEIAKIQKEGISDEEYQKVRNQMTKDIVSQAASTGEIAFQLAHEYTLFHDTKRVNSELDRYLAVSKQDIQRVAKKYLSTNARSVIVYTVPKS
ncbi:MAG: pitrilysin family protein [Bacteroidota bacterium]|nr:pitrilysin family protein [Bacteroidota bacterium]MDP4236384.1 pitrilysin family protein [Bacteroidota bacterium]